MPTRRRALYVGAWMIASLGCSRASIEAGGGGAAGAGSHCTSPLALPGLPDVPLSNGHGTVSSQAVVDVDGDGKRDLVLVNGGLTVALNHGDGTFAAGTHYDTGGTAVSVTAADLNGDGKPDLVVVNTSKPSACCSTVVGPSLPPSATTWGWATSPVGWRWAT